jgi:hypothetical protein
MHVIYNCLSEYKNWWVSRVEDIVIPKRKQDKAVKPTADDTTMVPFYLIFFYLVRITGKEYLTLKKNKKLKLQYQSKHSSIYSNLGEMHREWISAWLGQ